MYARIIHTRVRWGEFKWKKNGSGNDLCNLSSVGRYTNITPTLGNAKKRFGATLLGGLSKIFSGKLPPLAS